MPLRFDTGEDITDGTRRRLIDNLPWLRALMRTILNKPACEPAG